MVKFTWDTVEFDMKFPVRCNLLHLQQNGGIYVLKLYL